jgi:hypothetical protein
MTDNFLRKLAEECVSASAPLMWKQRRSFWLMNVHTDKEIPPIKTFACTGWEMSRSLLNFAKRALP